MMFLSYMVQNSTLITISNDVNGIARTAKNDQTLSVVLLAAAISCGVIAVIFWFLFRIPHAFAVLTGIGARKEIAALEKASSTEGMHHTVSLKKGKAAISWNTSRILKKSAETTTPLPSGDEEATTLLSSTEKTVVLEQNMQDPDSTPLDPEATTLLDEQAVAPLPKGFRLEQDKVYTDAGEKI